MVTVIATPTTTADTGTPAAISLQRRPGSSPSGKTSSNARNPVNCQGHATTPSAAIRSAPGQGVLPQASTAGTTSSDAASQASAAPIGPVGARTAISQPSASGTSPSR